MLPPRLRAQYPQEMTIVLQHQFWDLTVDEEAGTISVGLSFGGVPSTLHDPARRDHRLRRPVCALWPALPADATPEGRGRPAPEPGAGAAAPNRRPRPTETPQVVSLDAFRRRTPPTRRLPD